MRNYFKILTILSLFVFLGCSKDEAPNTAPVIESQSFNVFEDIESSSIIGKVIATDAENDNLNFSLTVPSGSTIPLLFEISSDGKLKLTSGKSLDYDVSRSHTIQIKVTDGKLSSVATVIINVLVRT